MKRLGSFVTTWGWWDSVRRGNWEDSILIDTYGSSCPAAVILFFFFLFQGGRGGSLEVSRGAGSGKNRRCDKRRCRKREWHLPCQYYQLSSLSAVIKVYKSQRFFLCTKKLSFTDILQVITDIWCGSGWALTLISLSTTHGAEFLLKTAEIQKKKKVTHSNILLDRL